MKISMLYRQFYDMNGKELMIGGVETYISNLIKLFINNKYEVYVYQFANIEFQNEFEGAKIIGVCPQNKFERMYKNRIRAMVSESYKYTNPDCDILIFCTDNDIIKTHYKKVIAIQHGIGWDVHNLKLNSAGSLIRYWLTNSKRAFSEYIQYKRCNTIVCVDYNFINWYRTCIHDDELNYRVIPNFSFIPEYKERKENNYVSVIFARRFQTYRGTKIFAHAISRIMDKFSYVKVMVAGDGPEEKFLHTKLDKYDRVVFARFMPNESIKIHSNFDIAVVPSTASEGTSLSLIEAMASGCAVVCTDIGGLTNIIIDGHNGLITRPDEDELFYNLEKLICDSALRKKLSWCGYETVKDSFDINNWSQKWMDTIKQLK